MGNIAMSVADLKSHLRPKAAEYASAINLLLLFFMVICMSTYGWSDGEHGVNVRFGLSKVCTHMNGAVTYTDLTGDCKTYSTHTAGLLSFGWILYFLVFAIPFAIMHEYPAAIMAKKDLFSKASIVLACVGWFFYLVGWAQYTSNVPDKCNWDQASGEMHKGPSFSFTVFIWILYTPFPGLLYLMLHNDGTEGPQGTASEMEGKSSDAGQEVQNVSSDLAGAATENESASC